MTLYRDLTRTQQQVVSWQMRWGALPPHLDLRTFDFAPGVLDLLIRNAGCADAPLDVPPIEVPT